MPGPIFLKPVIKIEDEKKAPTQDELEDDSVQSSGTAWGVWAPVIEG